MEEKEFITTSAIETEKVGSEFAKNVKVGDVVLLSGELGAGKTTFVQGVAKTLFVKTRVISPTFILVRKHHGKIGGKKINLYHIDLYRLDSSETKNLGIEETFEDPIGIFLIEWGEKHDSLKSSWEIKIDVTGDSKRKITIKRNE